MPAILLVGLTLFLGLTAWPSPSAVAADPADQEFFYAEALAQRGLDALAVLVMEGFTQKYADHPRFEEALVTRAKYLQKMGDLKGSLAALDEFLQKYSYSRFKIEALCRSAELSYDLKQWAQAAEKLRALLEIKEQLPAEWILRARYYLAWCLSEMGRCDEALHRFRDFAALCPDTDLAREARLAVGDCLRRLKRYEEAFAAYGRVLGESSGEQAIAAAFGMGLACQEAKEYRRAAVAFGEVIRRGAQPPLAPQALWRRADCLAAAGDKAGARASIRELVTRFTDDALSTQALERLGRLLLEEPNPTPSGDLDLYALVKAHIQSKQWTKAELLLGRQGPPSPWRFRARLALASAFEKSNVFDKAAFHYHLAHSEGGKDALAAKCLLRAADLRLKGGNDAEASLLLREFLKLYPQHLSAVVAQWNLGHICLKERRYSEAAELFEAATRAGAQKTSAGLGSSPSPISEHLSLLYAGFSWALADQDEKAISVLERIDEGECPWRRSPEAVVLCAEALARTNAYGRAVELLRQLMTHKNDEQFSLTSNREKIESSLYFPWAAYRLGIFCERAGAWTEAADGFSQAAKSFTSSPLQFNALLHRALCLFHMGRPEECASALVEMMRRYPGIALPAPTYAWLARDRLKAGEVARARLVCEALTQRIKDDTYRHFARLVQAECDMALGKWGEAKTKLDSLLKDGVSDATLEYLATRLLADCHWRLGDAAEAAKLICQLARHSRGRAAVETEVSLAQFLQAKARPAEAAAIYKHALLLANPTQNPDLVRAAYEGLAECEESLGHPSAANAFRARAMEVGIQSP